MTRSELDTVVEWAATEGWNPGLHDADIFWQTDPEGFIALENEGELIGSGSIVSYAGKYGFMGFFIIKPKYRGKGLGTELWFYRRDALIDRLEQDAPIGMDGVFNMQNWYAKGGFTFSHRDLRFVGKAREEGYSSNVSTVEDSDFDSINHYDMNVFMFDREVFLKGWLHIPDSFAFQYKESNKVKGYGVVRKCRNGYKIGPLFADNPNIAHELFKALSSKIAGETVYIDVPEINNDSMSLAKEYSMQKMFGCAKMYYGSLPYIPYDKVFGVTTFELG